MQTAFHLAMGLVDELVEEALAAAEANEPPIDAVEVARGLGMEVRLDREQRERGRLVLLHGLPTIVCRPEPRAERYHWTIAHEIGEYMIAQSADRWSGDVVVWDGAVREWLANCFATHLLTPRELFLSSCRACDFDLHALKDEYATASHEVIALRTLESEVPAIVTIFDLGKQSRRLGNLSYRIPNFSSAERRCRDRSARSGQYEEEFVDGMRVRCWPIHEEGWKREILRSDGLGGVFD